MLAQEIVARFHSQRGGGRGAAPNSRRASATARCPRTCRRSRCTTNGAALPIAQLAKQAGIVDSTSEALRLIAQRGLKVDGDVVADKALVVAAGTTVVVQAGKRKFARVTRLVHPASCAQRADGARSDVDDPDRRPTPSSCGRLSARGAIVFLRAQVTRDDVPHRLAAGCPRLFRHRRPAGDLVLLARRRSACRRAPSA